MPYKVLREKDKWVVHKMMGEEPGESMGEHDSEEEAMAQMRALYANEKKSWAVKMADDDSIEGPGMPFGGPFNGQDLDGEHFSAKTDFAFDWFTERPLLYHHGLDQDTGIAVVGRVKSWETKADLGVWTRAQLDASSEYFDAIKELVKQGKLFFSSGAMRHLVKVNKKNGEITRWPWVELSLTPTPSNLLAEVQTAEKHFELAGLKAVWAKAELPSEDKEAIDKLNEYIDAMTSFSDEEINDLEEDELDNCIALIDGLTEGEEETKAGGHAGHGGAHAGHGGGTMGPVSKRRARTRVMGALESRRNQVMADLRNVRTMRLNSPQGEAMRRDIIKGAQSELAGIRKKMVAARVKYKSAKADLTTEQRKKLGEEDFAYIDSDGGRHLPMHDAAHARNALARFDQTEFESEEAKQKARKKLEARAKELGIDVSAEKKSADLKAISEDGMRKMIRSMADKMNVQVTDKDMQTMMDDMSDMMDEPVSKVMATIADHLRATGNHKATNIDDLVASLKDMPLVTHTELLSDMAASLLERTKDLQERRTKEGRMISSANRKRLMQCMENMRGAMDEMESLMSASEPQAKADSLKSRAMLTLVASQLETLQTYADTLSIRRP